MLLSTEDIERLERLGFNRKAFTVTGGDGLTRLRNVGGWCRFYDSNMKRCQVYEDRPLGCFIYPVMYSDVDGVVTDEFCPMRHTISKRELRMKGQILVKHLEKITSGSHIASSVALALKPSDTTNLRTRDR